MKRQKTHDEKDSNDAPDGDEDQDIPMVPQTHHHSHSPRRRRRRYMMTVAYDGSRFKGFQRQTSQSSSSSSSSSSSPSSSPWSSNTTTTTTTNDPKGSNSSNRNNKRELRKNKIRRHDNATGKIIHVSTTVQELLEDALEMYASSLLVTASSKSESQSESQSPQLSPPKPAQQSSKSSSSPSFQYGWNRDMLRMRFAGRTDAGVHASGQVIAVDLPVVEVQVPSTTPTPAADDVGISTTTTTTMETSTNDNRKRKLELNENVDNSHASASASTSASTSASASDSKETEETTEELWRIRRAINSRLPVDISIENVEVAPHENFDPRKEAVRKRYSYTVRYRRAVFVNPSPTGHDPTVSATTENGKQEQKHNHDDDSKNNAGHNQQVLSPISTDGGPNLLRSALDPTNGRCWIVPWPIDDTKLEDYCQVLTGTHDFSAFVHKSSRQEQQQQQSADDGGNCNNNHIRTVDVLKLDRTRTVHQDGADICDVKFTTEAKGFGRNQVRYMIGFLIDLCRCDGRGALALDIQPSDDGDKVSQWLWDKDQDYGKLAAKIQKAAACGLILEKVYF